MSKTESLELTENEKHNHLQVKREALHPQAQHLPVEAARLKLTGILHVPLRFAHPMQELEVQMLNHANVALGPILEPILRTSPIGPTSILGELSGCLEQIERQPFG